MCILLSLYRKDCYYCTLTLFYLDVTLDLNQTSYIVSESQGYIYICAELNGELERPVLAEISVLSSTAIGEIILHHFILSCSAIHDFYCHIHMMKCYLLPPKHFDLTSIIIFSLFRW